MIRRRPGPTTPSSQLPPQSGFWPRVLTVLSVTFGLYRLGSEYLAESRKTLEAPLSIWVRRCARIGFWLVGAPLLIIGYLSNIAGVKDLPGFGGLFTTVRGTIAQLLAQYPQVLALITSGPFLAMSLVAVVVLAGVHMVRRGNLAAMFTRATARLADGVPKEILEAATKSNGEAEALVKLIGSGRHEAAFQALRRLWRWLTRNMPDAPPLLAIVDVKWGTIEYPVVDVPLPQNLLGSAPSSGLRQLLRLDERSSGVLPFSPTGTRTREDTKQFLLCEPRHRYLTRYKGPDARTGFRNDYVGMNLCLRELKIQQGEALCPLPVKLEPYGNIMDSADALIDETYLLFASRSQRLDLSPKDLLRFLPWRRRVHGSIDEADARPILKPTGRAAGFGIAALTVFREERNGKPRYRAILGLRSSKVGTYKNVWHVIPAGMANFDPKQGKLGLSDSDLLVQHNPGAPEHGCINLLPLIEKEFLEELFNDPVAATAPDAPSTQPWTEVVQRRAEKHLYGPSGEFQASIYLTGLVIDLLNYRPEVCALILIDSPEWFRQFEPDPYAGAGDRIDPNWEVHRDELAALTHTRKHAELKFVDIFSDRDVMEAMPPEGSVLSGAAAFHKGVQRARELIRQTHPEELWN